MSSTSDTHNSQIVAEDDLSATPPITNDMLTPTHDVSDDNRSPNIKKKKRKSGSKSPKCSSKSPKSECKSPKSPGSPVSEDSCPICLGRIADKCVAGSCLHNFCFVCLKEWSKQKPVCPLCKQPFEKIIYSIKSENVYKEWVVPKPRYDPAESNIQRFREFFGGDTRRFFGYNTTARIFIGREQRRRNDFDNNRDVLPNGPREERDRDRRSGNFDLRTSSMFRLSVYLNNIWVLPISDITGRYRETSPTLYRDQPALTHRLTPWINRELAALLPSSRVGHTLTKVMDLLEVHPINSRAFKNAISEDLGGRASHFCHELYHFARSPYDIVGHDNASRYAPRYTGPLTDVVSSSSSDDSDAIIEVDESGAPVPPQRNLETFQGDPNDVVREEVLTNEGSVVISSDDETSSDEGRYNRISSDMFLQDTHNPEPPRSLRHRSNNNIITGVSVSQSDSISSSEPGPSRVTRSSTTAVIKPEHLSDNEQVDDCLVVSVLPPKAERTPELINLDSDSDNKATTIHVSDDENESRKVYLKRPRLDRTSFALHNSSSKPGPSGITNRNETDHSYCNATKSSSSKGCSYNNRRDSSSEMSSDSSKQINKSIKLNRHKYSSSKQSKSNYAKKDHSSKIKSLSKIPESTSKSSKECIIERLVYFTQSIKNCSDSETEELQNSDDDDLSSASSTSKLSEDEEVVSRSKTRKILKKNSSSDDEYLPTSADCDRVKTKNKQEYFSKRLGASRSRSSNKSRRSSHGNEVYSTKGYRNKFHETSSSSVSKNRSQASSSDSLDIHQFGNRKRYYNYDSDIESTDSENEYQSKKRKVQCSDSWSWSDDDSNVNKTKNLTKKKKSHSKKKKKSKRHSSPDERSRSHSKSKYKKDKSKENKKSKKKSEKCKYKSVKCKSKLSVKKEKKKIIIDSSDSSEW